MAELNKTSVSNAIAAAHNKRSAASAAYNKKSTTVVCLRLNRKTDADVIDVLNAADNKCGYIKKLIREAVANG